LMYNLSPNSHEKKSYSAYTKSLCVKK